MSVWIQRQEVRAVIVAVLLVVLYSATARYSAPYGVDAFTNAAQARAFAEDQDSTLEEFSGFETDEFRGSLAWFVESPEGVTSQYPPGAAAWATPFYLFDSSFEFQEFSNETPLSGSQDVAAADVIEFDVPIPNLAPASLAAALSVAIAMAFFMLTLSKVMPAKAAALSVALAAIGTGAWSVAADRLWQHGPAMMCISGGTYLASINRFAASGLFFGAGVIVRPHTAVVAAGIGVVVAWRRRSLREMSLLGGVSALGLVALVVYNNSVFGSPSISGGYSSAFGNRLVSESPFTVIGRLAGSLVHLQVGILWTSPFIALSLFALWKARGSAPDWSVGAALGGFAYLVIQFRANRLTGGGDFFSYRYPLEALMAAGPLLAISTWTWLQEPGRNRRVFAVLAGLSVFAHGAGAVLT